MIKKFSQKNLNKNNFRDNMKMYSEENNFYKRLQKKKIFGKEEEL